MHSYYVFTGIDSKKLDKCMGDPDADLDNPVLKEEQDAQVNISHFHLYFPPAFHSYNL